MDDSNKSSNDIQCFFAGDLGEQLRFILVVSIIVSAFWLITGFIGYRVFVSPSESGLLAQAETAALADALAEESYYRGLYDMCGFFALKVFGLSADVAAMQCLQAVIGSYEAGWYAEPSSGWTWPLPARDE